MEIEINKNQSEGEIYENCSKVLEYLLSTNDKIISNITNYIALLKQSFSKISWIGYYIYENEKLFLGPFQGNTACTEIRIGKGVCGTSALEKRTIIVKNVNEFPGHIACDSKSESEIVVPIIINGKVWGVLDIDSYTKNSFSEVDQKYLESQIEFLINKLDFNKYILS